MSSPRERRRAPRAQASFPIQLSPDADAKPAEVRDISEIGLACRCADPIDEMTAVRVDLQLPGAEAHHEVTGAVVRCEPLAEKPARYDVAIYFTEVGEVTRRALHEFVAAQLPA